jgi:hypothetical protein
MDRRNALRMLTTGGAMAAVPPITDAKTIMTQPAADHLVIVKVMTSEPGCTALVALRIENGRLPSCRRSTTI